MNCAMMKNCENSTLQITANCSILHVTHAVNHWTMESVSLWDREQHSQSEPCSWKMAGLWKTPSEKFIQCGLSLQYPGAHILFHHTLRHVHACIPLKWWSHLNDKLQCASQNKGQDSQQHSCHHALQRPETVNTWSYHIQWYCLSIGWCYLPQEQRSPLTLARLPDAG